MVAAVTGRRHRAAIVLGGLLAGITAAALAGLVLVQLLGDFGAGGSCGAQTGAATELPVTAGGGMLAGATEYGGPGDPSSGTVGASGASLLANPDTYAELGGDTFQTATAMGGLPYGTALRISWGTHAGIAYKRDFGLGGGPVGGLPRVIDLWWQFAERLGIPYRNGLWSGPVRIERPPGTGAGSLVGPGAGAPALTSEDDGADVCSATALAGVPVTAGQRARLLPERTRRHSRRGTAGRQGDHRGRQPDRRAAVRVRRRTRAGAVGRGAGL